MPSTQEDLDLIADFQRTKCPRTGDRILRKFDRWCHGQAHRAARKGMEYDLALQAARLGLIDAVERFEPERGFALLTYASMRVRKRVAEARAEGFGGPSTAVLEARRVIGHAMRQLQEAGLPATDEAVAKHLGWGTARVTAARRRMVSMDAPFTVGDEGDSATMHEVIPSPAHLRPDRLTEKRLENRALRGTLEAAMVTSLSERNAEIMLMFLEAECETGAMAAIAKKLGVTRQRVSLAVQKSMPKLERALRLNGYGAQRAREFGQ